MTPRTVLGQTEFNLTPSPSPGRILPNPSYKMIEYMPLLWTVKLGKKTCPPGSNLSHKSSWICGRDRLNEKAILWIEVRSFWKYINSFRSLEYRLKKWCLHIHWSITGVGKLQPMVPIWHVKPVLVIKYYWKPAMLTHVCVVYSCFCVQMTEMSSLKETV